jgi:hypothetical protein
MPSAKVRHRINGVLKSECKLMQVSGADGRVGLKSFHLRANNQLLEVEMVRASGC